ncbi:MAG: prolyl-tRNA synthetase associated domain-containing protein [Ruminococcaceae bacterium]|nr:prolyl-tRNA synthetase associated domain-containing protein [Oscillospiraceae bacterium]
MEIYQTRPTDPREPQEIRCYDLLEQLQIPFERVDHQATDSIEECDWVSKVLGIEICKNLFLCNRQKTEFYLVMMPGKKKFETRVLSKALEVARLSFAPQELLPELLGLHPGSVSILGLMNDKENHVRLIMDRDVITKAYIGCHPCKNTSSLKIATADVMKKLLPAIHHEPTIVDL